MQGKAVGDVGIEFGEEVEVRTDLEREPWGSIHSGINFWGGLRATDSVDQRQID